MTLPRLHALAFDFDSTLVTVEALDELAKICLANAPDAAARIQLVEAITADGMNGTIDFATSLSRRMAAIRPIERTHITRLIEVLRESLSPSVTANTSFIRENADSIWVISGGFKDFIVPVVSTLGIAADHVLANAFIWDGDQVIDYDRTLPLARDGGKIHALEDAGISKGRELVFVGDGMTDFAVYKAGVAQKFIAYTETIARPHVLALADYRAASMGDVFSFLSFERRVTE